ncbi:hypothetical protein WR25_03950 [Diploscapter pachys]|uniref:SXP/RAL-2 family protein Ani s 5-like cation-binding domain-containing protein n=1 Tax=Diploscapter pachys TaxID=2018661 RepID=A0A2A2KS30_9BILA|nr:hypothetical protein WR25_03950 [Diploscapter pachys]
MVSRCLLVALLVSAVSAGFLDNVSGVTSDVGSFFSKQFNNVKDLFASDQSGLESNVQRVYDLLNVIKEKAKMLEPLASDSQKATLGKVDQFLSQVTAFQTQVKNEGAAKFNENKSRWQSMVQNIFEKNGLNDIVKLLKLNSSPGVSTFVAICAPIILAVIYH